MKNRYFLFISFKGTSYHGWQSQPNSVTIQKKIEEALTRIFRESISLTGAGRTDAGVHALMFVAHFDISFSLPEEVTNLIYRINSILPTDISIKAVRKVSPDAHARFSAVSRTYKYFISALKDPFWAEYSWFLPGRKDLDRLNAAAEILKSHSDFTSFSRLHSNNKTNICRIYDAFWEEKENILVFTIKADRFLRNMVRAIVGTMIRTGTGKMSLEEFGEIINARNRSKAGQSAVAKGLFLTGIEYPDDIFSQ